MFRQPSSILPNVPIYSLEWGFGKQFGGITNSAIQRTNAFAELGNRRMVFLTVDPKVEPKKRTRELRAEGRFSKLVSIRNMWHELRTMSDRKLRKFSDGIDSPQGEPGGEPLEKPGDKYHAERTDAKGKVVRVDYFRKNGSILASDQHDLMIDGRRARRVTLFSSQGSPIAQWSNLSELYYSWLDSILGTDPCVLITDTGGIGGRMRTYDRDNVVKVQMLHNLHLASNVVGNEGPIDPIWKNVIINSDKYDVLGVLTEDQRRDLTETQLNPGNLQILSNMYQGDVLSDIKPRPKTVGTQVSRLAKQKRIDHTLKAIAKSENATIDIYGFAHSSAAEQELHELADALAIGDRAVFRGYDPRARDSFKAASFSLLPSLYEGQPLVIIESMAAGCIPIAYDIKYGPASMITHGVDGFLVPAGDVDALAETIDYVTRLDDETLSIMRRNAVERSKDFLPKTVVEHWGTVLRKALETKPKQSPGKGKAVAIEATFEAADLVIKVKISGVENLGEQAAFAWKSRSSSLYGRVAARCVPEEGTFLVEGEIPATRLDHDDENIFDLFVDVRSNNAPVRMRIKSDSLEVPPPSGNLEPYSTANASLSVKTHVAGLRK